jgi:hypothetical protein
MSKPHILTLLFILAALAGSCTAPAVLPEDQIVRHPEPADYSGFQEFTSPPIYDPNSKDLWQIDLRSHDLTGLDLSKSTADLLFADFDSRTKWPPSDRMPADFNWQKIMELNKDPGLGIRALHKRGITGEGVAIAIIDQPLLVDHQEYRDRLRRYEEINILPDTKATMHGAAVASIAVGKTVGVAPAADLHYIGAWTGDWEPDTNNFTWNFEYYARAVYRILEVNQSLPEDRRIRVIAMQVGWHPDRRGYSAITAAVSEAKAAGILVISSSLSETYGWNFHGLERTPLSDPNHFWSYSPGLWWQDEFYPQGFTSHTLLVPMDSRTTASPTGTEDYVFYRQGGWSWSIPYLAGMYALATQVKPEIMPEEFWGTALQTGRTIHIDHLGKDYEFGVILNPQALITALEDK